jgi:hypothetical protein
MPNLQEHKSVTIPQEKLRGMLRKTSFAISTDESRYVLNGIFISLKEHKLTMVATMAAAWRWLMKTSISQTRDKTSSLFRPKLSMN